jgi:type I restriction enzyme S subunit
MKHFKIFYPEFNEQIRIATILTEVEDEIIKLEKKLVKAKSIKQGMMQNLLTGKIRLI